jgi:hypothetical protein
MQNFEISPYIHANKNFLHSLSKSKSENKRRHLLKKANSTQLLSLVEICLNILTSRFDLTSRQRHRLFPHADFLRQLARSRSEKGARKLIIQKGNGLPGLFAAVLTPILIELARSAFTKSS